MRLVWIMLTHGRTPASARPLVSVCTPCRNPSGYTRLFTSYVRRDSSRISFCLFFVSGYPGLLGRSKRVYESGGVFLKFPFFPGRASALRGRCSDIVGAPALSAQRDSRDHGFIRCVPGASAPERTALMRPQLSAGAPRRTLCAPIGAFILTISADAPNVRFDAIARRVETSRNEKKKQ